jgi:sulfite reductase beta subunit-like hemoprotein
MSPHRPAVALVITGAQMRVLAELSHAYADGAVRVTVAQNLVFRWVHADELPGLSAAAGLGLPDADTVADV